MKRRERRSNYYDAFYCLTILELMDDARAVNDDETYTKHYIELREKLKKIKKECDVL